MFALVVAVVLAEAGGAFITRLLRPVGFLESTAIDALVGLSLVIVAMYWLSFRPLAREIKRRSCAEEALAQANATLEQRVAERGEALRVALEKYRVLFESFPLGITVTDATGRILETNREAERLLGLSESEQRQRGIGTPEWRLVRPDGTPMPPEEYASVRALVERRQVDNVEMGVFKGKGVTWLNVTAAPIPLEGYGVAITYGDVTARRETAEALRLSEARFRSLYVSMTEGVALHDLECDAGGNAVDYIILDINPAYERITGLAREEVIGRRASEVYGIGRAPYLEIYAAVASTSIPTTFETYFEPMGKHFSVSAFSPGKGKFATVFTDITERKRAEEVTRASLKEKELLLKEIHHRVKNNLQIIASMLSLQAGHVHGERELEALRDSQDRIRTLALIHEKLYRSDDLARIDFRSYVQELAGNLLRSHRVGGRAVSLRVGIGEVYLDINSAIPIALIINELVANSLKHAFGGREGGEIGIELTRRGDGQYTLVVSDDGVGLPVGVDFRNTESLGLQIVSVLVTQLRGEIQLEESTGTRFVMKFSLDE